METMTLVSGSIHRPGGRTPGDHRIPWMLHSPSAETRLTPASEPGMAFMQQKKQSKVKQIYLEKNTSWPKHVHLFLSLSTDIICKLSLIWSLAGAQERLNKSRSQSFKRKRGRVKFWNEKTVSALIYFLCKRKCLVLFNFYRGIL